MFATRLIKIAKKIHTEIDASAEVAECRHTTENRIDSASQNAIYTTVKNQKDQDPEYLFRIRHQSGDSHPDCSKCNAHRENNDCNYR